jgi:hypothetical protein
MTMPVHLAPKSVVFSFQTPYFALEFTEFVGQFSQMTPGADRTDIIFVSTDTRVSGFLRRTQPSPFAIAGTNSANLTPLHSRIDTRRLVAVSKFE